MCYYNSGDCDTSSLLYLKRGICMRKYTKGDPIRSFDELMQQEFVYLNHKITHKGWFMSWRIQSADFYMKAGRIFKAIKISDGKLLK
jgi:hypothetical protein